MEKNNLTSDGLMAVAGTPWGDLTIAAEWSGPRYVSPASGEGIVVAYTCGVYAYNGGHIATVQIEPGRLLSHAVVWDHEDGGRKYYAPEWLVALLPPAPTD